MLEFDAAERAWRDSGASGRPVADAGVVPFVLPARRPAGAGRYCAPASLIPSLPNNFPYR